VCECRDAGGPNITVFQLTLLAIEWMTSGFGSGTQGYPGRMRAL
jgi:hypothetical protein